MQNPVEPVKLAYSRSEGAGDCKDALRPAEAAELKAEMHADYLLGKLCYMRGFRQSRIFFHKLFGVFFKQQAAAFFAESLGACVDPVRVRRPFFSVGGEPLVRGFVAF